MSAFRDEPPCRLKEQRHTADAFERLAGQAARDLPSAKPLSATALARIAARIDEQVPAAHRPRRYGWAFVTAALLMGIATAASAQRWEGLRQWITTIAAPEPAERQVAPHRVSKPRAGAGKEKPPAAALDGVKSPPPGAAPVMESRPVQPPPNRPAVDNKPGSAVAPATGRNLHLAYIDRREPPRPSQPAAATTVVAPAPGVQSWPSPPATAEIMPKTATMGTGSPQATRYLSQAVRALRVEHSPTSALLLLDRHAEELEGNAFAREALLVRVEAMLALGRQNEVLHLLDGTPLTEGTASRSLLLTRGQLRAAAKRCAEGLIDFNLVLAEARQPPKPALLGRARCKLQLGDQEGARADVERYRKEFPGDHASDDLGGLGTRP